MNALKRRLVSSPDNPVPNDDDDDNDNGNADDNNDDNNDRSRPRECIACHLVFTRPSNYSRHMNNVHLKASGVRFQCERCSRSYLTRGNLIRHMNDRHSSLPLYRCDECEREFQTSSALWQHKQRAHANVRFRCSACVESLGARAYEYKTQTSCHKHIAKRHRGNGDEEEAAKCVTVRRD
jgi:uncharacterized C2H2 Zn-finger protein